MIANVGFGLLFIAFLTCLYAIITAIYGMRTRAQAFIDSARLAAIVNFGLITLAVLGLWSLMLREQYQYTYVFRVINHEMPLILKITALWGGQAGSLLFWVWLLSGVTALSFLWSRHTQLAELTPWVIILTMGVQIFFLFMVLFFENPFERIWITTSGTVVTSFIQPAGTYPVFPTKGMGLNPLLRHFGMVLHPPLLYLGFVTFLVPFAYAAASLITGRLEGAWLHLTRRWALLGWLFLSAGLVLGSRWSYDVLGWGGYWGWDPVEIAALMPWLTSTAFLHSVVVQERRDLFKRWNYVLILATFCLVILGTFLTRTGVLSSVHAFAESSVGPIFFVLIGLLFCLSLGLLLWRWNALQGSGEIRSFFSRESFFLFNNIIFLCITLICLTGVIFPILSQTLTGQKVTVGPEWYKATTGPLFALLLLLMGVVPLTIWGASTAKRLWPRLWKLAAVSLVAPLAFFVLGVRSWGALFAAELLTLAVVILVVDFFTVSRARSRNNGERWLAAAWHLIRQNHSRYGGYLVHLGVVCMAVGIVGMEFFQTQTQVSLNEGQDLTFAGYTLRFERLLQLQEQNSDRLLTEAQIDVTSAEGRTLQIVPRIDTYQTQQTSVTIPGVWSSAAGDLYVVLVEIDPQPVFRVFFNPLVNWLWGGAIILALGGLLAFWPATRSTREQAS
jgi:cytochrome c-type biogenesis protein CcmF